MVAQCVKNLLTHRGDPWVTTVAKADRSRLTIRGLIDGHRYIVREQPGGWFITPEKTHRVKKPA
jgi:hypothetical protein